MRLLLLGSAVACMIAGGAEAFPARSVPLGRALMPLDPIRWTCNQYRCLDQWTGNETAAFCDNDGCHPTRAFGRQGPSYRYGPPPRPRGYGYGYGYAPPPPPRGYGYAPPSFGYEDD